MICIVEIHRNNQTWYAIRWTWFGMFKRYKWTGSNDEWSGRKSMYFRSNCLFDNFPEAKQRLDMLNKVGAFTETETIVEDLEKVVYDD